MNRYRKLIYITNDSGCCNGKPFYIMYGPLDKNEDGIYFTVQAEDDDTFTIKKEYNGTLVKAYRTNNVMQINMHSLSEVMKSIFSLYDDIEFNT